MHTSVTRDHLSGKLGLLAAREMLCLLGVASGLSSKQIAQQDGCSPSTVDKRLLSAAFKLNTAKRAALVAKAFALGLISFVGTASPAPQRQQENLHDGVFLA
jgi:DNA-binding CsgD family transcriptional regulator